MSFAASLAGAILPVLLMLSPFAVMAARDCPDWTPPAQAASGEGKACPRPLPPLM